MYSSPTLIRTPLLPNSSVLIGEVSFLKGGIYIYSQYFLQECVSFLEVCPL